MYLDVGGSLGKNDFQSEVFCNNCVKIMIKSVVENISSIIFISEKMEPSWNIVALTPVSFPLSHYWESWLYSEFNLFLISKCI
jgi:hypothetical protein